MQALIPVFAILGAAAAAGAQLTLLPYAYLADPLPVYHQSQDTRAGVHAYSYAGGPSAKEEVRGLDGVTRGSYSYVDAHGILQSVFYVADEGGFRVAATNLPTDDNLPLEPGELLTARYAYSQKHARAAGGEEVHLQASGASRSKRSLEASADDQDRHRTENPSSQGDQADQSSAAIASPKSSHELPTPDEEKSKGRANRAAVKAVVAPVYGLLDSVLIPRLTGAATSQQSRVDVHNNVRLKAARLVKTAGLLSEPVYETTVILPSQVPLATLQQSRVQVHNNLRVQVPEEPVVNAETIGIEPGQVVVTTAIEPLISAFSDYNENRIQLHNILGLEGSNRKDTVKIDRPLPIAGTPIPVVTKDVPPVIAKEALSVVVNEAVPVVIKDVPSVITKEALPVVNEAVPVVVKDVPPVVIKEPLPVVANEAVPVVTKDVSPVVIKEALPVVTAISSQSRTQIHRNTKLEAAIPIVSEPTVYLATSYARPISTWPILAPVAQSSQYRRQIHSNEKLELAI
ncbi:uncharacterized protein LOC143903411 [Temnothorax americanus]|uniref:uncharacterized protein LOC143903411 n=1 Tax=Temnothorax americanus TaxID=1964332 RepID=UPI004068EE60